MLIFNSNTNYCSTILFNVNCCFTVGTTDLLLSAKPSPCIQNDFFKKMVLSKISL